MGRWLVADLSANGRKLVMKHSTIGGFALALGLADFSLSVTPVPAPAQQPTIQRRVLLTQDLPIPGNQTVMAAVEVPAGGREGRHTHPGALFVYVLEGTLTLDYEGKPTMTYKAGDTIYLRPAKSMKASITERRP